MDLALEAPVAARALLRDACAQAHARLDGRLSTIDFNHRASYCDLLTRMSGPVSALEGALSAGIAPALFANWACRLRSHALRGDIAKLGGCYRHTRMAPAEDEAAAFGALYVLEGSRLGGHVLARMADMSTDAAVRGATRYFRHGQGAGLWRSFVDALEASPGVRANPQRAVRAARDAFAHFEAAFA